MMTGERAPNYGRAQRICFAVSIPARFTRVFQPRRLILTCGYVSLFTAFLFLDSFSFFFNFGTFEIEIFGHLSENKHRAHLKCLTFTRCHGFVDLRVARCLFFHLLGQNE